MVDKKIEWPHAPPHRLSLGGAYFVTAATYLKQHHFRGRRRLEVVHRGLLKVLKDAGWNIEAWAVFSKHYHFVANTADPSNLGRVLKDFHAKLAIWVNRLDRTPRRKVFYNFRETHLTFEESYFARLNYTHQNPVKHGLVGAAREYPWCSASWFEREAAPSHVKTVYAFKTDRVNVEDDFEVDSQW
jgi:putative transposase